MIGLEITTIGEVLEKIVGGGTPSKQRPDYWNGPIPWASVKDMVDGQYKLSNTKDSITIEGLNNSATNLIPSGNVIISTRMGLGRVYINEVDMAINQDLKALFPKKDIVNEYLLWFMASIAEKLEALGSGTTVKGIRLEQLKSLEFIKPHINVQRKIATILSTYDDLIENNMRRIKNLEEMAQNLYREWFVNFRFPGHEQTRFVDSHLGKIPEGWRIKTLSDFGEIVTGKTPSKKVPVYYGEDMPFIKLPDMHNNIYLNNTRDNLSKCGADSQKSKTIPPDSLCVSCIGTVGKVAITSVASQTNQQINSIVLHNKGHLEFLYFTLQSLKQQIELYSATGATMNNLSRGKFVSLKVISPTDEVIKLFHELNAPPFHLILRLQQKNDLLRKTRDLLLPKLISGEVDVSDLDITLPEEALA